MFEEALFYFKQSHIIMSFVYLLMNKNNGRIPVLPTLYRRNIVYPGSVCDNRKRHILIIRIINVTFITRFISHIIETSVMTTSA